MNGSKTRSNLEIEAILICGVENLDFEYKFLLDVFSPFCEESEPVEGFEVSVDPREFLNALRKRFPWQLVENFVSKLPKTALRDIFDVPFSVLEAMSLRNAEELQEIAYFATDRGFDVPNWDSREDALQTTETAYELVSESFLEQIQRIASAHELEYINFLAKHPWCLSQPLEHMEQLHMMRNAITPKCYNNVTLCFDFAFSSCCADLHCSKNTNTDVRNLILSDNVLNSQGRCVVSHSIAFLALIMRQYGILEDIVPLRAEVHTAGFLDAPVAFEEPQADFHVICGSAGGYALQCLLIDRMRGSFFIKNGVPMEYVPFELLDIALQDNCSDTIGFAVNGCAFFLLGGEPADSEFLTRNIAGSTFANYAIPSGVMAQLHIAFECENAILNIKKRFHCLFSFENGAEDCDYPSTGLFQLYGRLKSEETHDFEHDSTFHSDIYLDCLKAHYPAVEIARIAGGIVLEFSEKRLFTVLVDSGQPEVFWCAPIVSQRFKDSDVNAVLCLKRNDDLGHLATMLEEYTLHNMSTTNGKNLQEFARKNTELKNYVFETFALAQLLRADNTVSYCYRYAQGRVILTQLYQLIIRILVRKLLLMMNAIAMQRKHSFSETLALREDELFKSYTITDMPDVRVVYSQPDTLSAIKTREDFALILSEIELYEFFAYLNWCEATRKITFEDVAEVLYELELTDRRAEIVSSYFDQIMSEVVEEPQKDARIMFLDEVKINLALLEPRRVSRLIWLSQRITDEEMKSIAALEFELKLESLLLLLQNTDLTHIYNILRVRPLYSYFSEQTEAPIFGDERVTFTWLKKTDYFKQERQCPSVVNPKEVGFAKYATSSFKQTNVIIEDIKTNFLNVAFKVFLLQVLSHLDHSLANQRDGRKTLASQYLKVLFSLLYTSYQESAIAQVINEFLEAFELDVAPFYSSVEIPPQLNELMREGIFFFSYFTEEETVAKIYGSNIYEYFLAQRKRLTSDAEKELSRHRKILQNKLFPAEESGKAAKSTFSQFLKQLIDQQQYDIQLLFDVPDDLLNQLSANRTLVDFDACANEPDATPVSGIEIFSAENETVTERKNSTLELYQPALLDNDNTCYITTDTDTQACDANETQEDEHEYELPPGIYDNQEASFLNYENSSKDIEGVFWIAQNDSFEYPDDLRIPDDKNFKEQPLTIEDFPPGLEQQKQLPESVFHYSPTLSSELCVLDYEKEYTDVGQNVLDFINSTETAENYLPLTSYHFMLAAYGKPTNTIFLPFTPESAEFYHSLFSAFPEMQLLVTDSFEMSPNGFQTYLIQLDEDYCLACAEKVREAVTLREFIPTDLLLLTKCSYISSDLILLLSGLLDGKINMKVKLFVPQQSPLAKTMHGYYGSVVELPCKHCFQFNELNIELVLDAEESIVCPKCRQIHGLTIFHAESQSKNDYTRLFGPEKRRLFLQGCNSNCWLCDGEACGYFDEFYYQIK